MGSRFMHLLIADYVGKELHIDCTGPMLLGAIAPDAKQVKWDTHYKGSRFKYSEGTPWEYGRFIRKYKSRISEPFMLGYLTHLVADEVWAMKAFFSGFRARLKDDSALYQRYHHDFWLCNAKLKEMFDTQGMYDALAGTTCVPQIDEVDAQEVFELRKYALADFDYPRENIHKELDVLSLDEILAYIERSAHRALDVCLPLVGS